jgi:hypothetical protein
MKRLRPGMKVTFSTEVRNNGTLTDASAITLKTKMGPYGTEQTDTPTHTGTGLYSVVDYVLPNFGGNLYGRWDTDGSLDVADEFIVNIADTAFNL